MNTKEQILNLYYNEHLKQNEIAKIIVKKVNAKEDEGDLTGLVIFEVNLDIKER